VVSAADVLAARKGEASLPPRALLITFDDGWKDNADFALPRLRKARLPALLFVVADVIGRRLPFFQEQLMAGWRLGRIDAERLLQVDWAEGRGRGGCPAVPAQGDCRAGTIER
jgi:hypothetical protein